MYAYLQGLLIQKDPQFVIIDVHGIGFEVEIPFSTFDQLPAENETITLQVLHYQREDVQKLFGFASAQEKKLFQMLLGVSKTGPKLALSILSSCSVADFVHAIQNQAVDYLQKIPGIGQKSAQRLILEMTEKVKQLPITAEEETTVSPILEDARKALVSVGFKNKDFEKVIQQIWKETPEITVNNLVRETLRQLGLRSGK